MIETETIEIDRNVDVAAGQIRRKILEMVAPILTQDCTATLSIFQWAIVHPGMNFEAAFSLRAAICENIVRPPALEISAAPNRDVLDLCKLERAIDPAAAPPFRRANVPVRMIIKRNEDDRRG